VRDLFGSILVGVCFGFVLSRVGFTSWDEVHRMFTFSDLRLVLIFGLAVVLLGIGWPTIVKLSKVRPRWSSRTIHRGTAVGALLFGIGWALSGACPSIALVQLGEGQLAALWTLGGILLGNWLYSLAHERLFRWDSGSCVDE
jgi:uncharacterized membrane protein YedE/YeeE